jgi:hypothetical protein
MKKDGPQVAFGQRIPGVQPKTKDKEQPQQRQPPAKLGILKQSSAEKESSEKARV